MLLILKNLVFSALSLGVVVVFLPIYLFERRAAWPAELGWNHWLGLLVAGTGLALVMRCTWLFTSYGQGTIAPFDPPLRLIQRGPYKRIRNPMYLGILIVLAGEAVFFLSWHIVVLWICMACAFHLMVELFEEKTLAFKFGAMYEDYIRAVPRWLPFRKRTRSHQHAPRVVASRASDKTGTRKDEKSASKRPG